MVKGKVKWFSVPKGYGFITGEDEKDYFVHYKKIVGDESKMKKLHEGQAVEFEVEETEKGLMAIDVRPATEEKG